MKRVIYEILNDISEGMLLLDENLKIVYLNMGMEHLLGVSKTQVLEKSWVEVMPALNRSFFLRACDNAMKFGWIAFFSAMMHKELIAANGEYYNLKISKVENEEVSFLLLEFINITSQVEQLNRIKTYANNLANANKELIEKEKEIRQLAYYDALTGVGNRTMFYEMAGKMLDSAKSENLLFGLMFVDVNKFKEINDSYGHEVGDKVLVRVANMLVDATRKNDMIVRYGGDEFLILLPNINDVDNYNIVVSRIFELKNNSMTVDGMEIPFTLSIGISFYPQAGDTIDDLVKRADEAMYIAKRGEGEDRCYCKK